MNRMRINKIHKCFRISLGGDSTKEKEWIESLSFKELNSLYNQLKWRRFNDFDFMSYKMNGDLVPMEGYAEEALWKPSL